MKKVSDIYKKLGIGFTFPIEIEDADCNPTYYENSDGDWSKYEYDANGNRTYFEDSIGYWSRCEYDAKGNQTYYEDSKGYKEGTPRSQSCAGKVIEVDGKKYKLMEL
jgi:YD repeat-containing protein